jgi:hypothetical protein
LGKNKEPAANIPDVVRKSLLVFMIFNFLKQALYQ